MLCWENWPQIISPLLFLSIPPVFLCITPAQIHDYSYNYDCYRCNTQGPGSVCVLYMKFIIWWEILLRLFITMFYDQSEQEVNPWKEQRFFHIFSSKRNIVWNWHLVFQAEYSWLKSLVVHYFWLCSCEVQIIECPAL